MLKLDIAEKAKAFIKKRQLKHQKQIVAKIQNLREDPFPSDSKSLKGSLDYKRADVGEYRIIYRVKGDTLIVAMVGKRNDDEVYRRFRKNLR
jgi:mRNA interferase RelE/StbE